MREYPPSILGSVFACACLALQSIAFVMLHSALSAMSRQRGSPRQGSGCRGKIQRPPTPVTEDGYDMGVSMPVRVLIDDWEARLVSEYLASGKGMGNINHYWLMKNMMGKLMEGMINCWISEKYSVLASRAKLIDVDDWLAILDATFSWKHLAIGRRGPENVEVGSGSASGEQPTGKGAPSEGNMAPLAPFLTPSTIRSPPSKQICNPVEHDPMDSRKIVSLPIKFPEPDDAFQGGCPILEETPPE